MLADAPAWGLLETLDAELAAAGFYLSGHPLDEYTEQLARLNVMRWTAFAERAQANGRAEARLAATVTYKQDRKAESGNRFAFAGFSDPTGQFEAVIFSDTLDLAGDKLEAGKNVPISVEGEAEGEALKVRVQAVQSLDEVLGKGTKRIAITATERLQIADLIKHLSREGSLEISLWCNCASRRRRWSSAWRITSRVSARQLSALKTLPGIVQVN